MSNERLYSSEAGTGAGTNEISDGYHTFGELYEHRSALWMALALTPDIHAWKSRQHEIGGAEMFPGYFIVGAQLPGAGPVTYHLEEKYWDLCPGDELQNALAYDGHTAPDVVQRLLGYVSETLRSRAQRESLGSEVERLSALTWEALEWADQTALVRYILVADHDAELARLLYPVPQVRDDIRRLPHELALTVADKILAERAGTAGRPTPLQMEVAIGSTSWCSLLTEMCSSSSQLASPRIVGLTWADLSDDDQAAVTEYADEYARVGDSAQMMFSRPDLADLAPEEAREMAQGIIGLLVGRPFKDSNSDDVLDAVGSVRWGQLKKIIDTKKNANKNDEKNAGTLDGK